MTKLEENNIYERLTICVNDKDKTFYILDNKTNTILYLIKDLDVAILVKKAYCDGYYDRKREELKYD
jgi:hypothetical protein